MLYVQGRFYDQVYETRKYRKRVNFVNTKNRALKRCKLWEKFRSFLECVATSFFKYRGLYTSENNLQAEMVYSI